MKKALAVLILMIIIFATFGFAAVKLAANGPVDSYFNKNLRQKLAVYEFWREMFKLHQDGDAKSDFLDSANKEILVRVINMKNQYINWQIMEAFVRKIEEATGKQADYVHASSEIDSRPSMSLDKLETLLEDEKKIGRQPEKSMLYLIVASTEKDNPNQLGSTLTENGIVLFEGTLSNYMVEKKLDLFEKLAVAVMLHEFGHQLGLDHNNLTGCIMNEKIEFCDKMDLQGIVTDFCDFEKEEIKK